MPAHRQDGEQQMAAAKLPDRREWLRADIAVRLPLILWMVSSALSALGVVFVILSASTPIPDRFGFRGADIIFAITFFTVGAVVARRHPENPVGWLFCAGGLVAAIVGLAEYSVYAVSRWPTAVAALATPGLAGRHRPSSHGGRERAEARASGRVRRRPQPLRS